CRVPALGRRGEWWLLTSLPVRGREEAAQVVEAYRRRWEVERFFRLLKTGLGLETFQVRGLARIRKVVAVLLGLAVFLWEVERLGIRSRVSFAARGQAGAAQREGWSVPAPEGPGSPAQL
ncbi:hypothetical protein AN926_04555, partial [Thermus scotoductus]